MKRDTLFLLVFGTNAVTALVVGGIWLWHGHSMLAMGWTFVAGLSLAFFIATWVDRR